MTTCTQTACRTGRRSVGVAAPDSDTERKADRMASQAMAGGPVHESGSGGEGAAIYRQCDDCETEEEMQLSPEPGTAPVSGAARGEAASAVEGGGRALSADLRSYFEPRFGSDLSGVRIHTDERASRAAGGINARAYTKGRDIAFAPGKFRPDTNAGRHLIAHELAHTQQNQTSLLARQEEGEDDEETATPEPLNLDTTHGGNTELRDEVSGALETEGTRIRGQVSRQEIAPETDNDPQQVVSTTHMTSLEFDTEACEIVMPFHYGFEQVEEDDVYCQGARMEGEPDIDGIADNYIREVNTRLNNQFKVRLSGCENDCADRDIPIRIEAVRDDANADKTVGIVPRSGRGSAAHICAGDDLEGTFAAHEGGHQILGRGDEYKASAADRRRVPRWGRDERVRGGYNLMGSRSQFGRFGVFHQRDFQHVLPFMRAAVPGCEPELVGIPQINIEVRILGQGGFGMVDGVGAGRGGLGIGLGIPLTRDRAWMLALEAHGAFVAQLSDDQRRFVLAGLRAGVEYQFGGPEVYGRVFGGAGAGVSHELGREARFPDLGDQSFGPRTSGFAEAYGGIGIGLSTGAGAQMLVQLQGSGGGELSSDSDAVTWFNVGLGLGARF